MWFALSKLWQAITFPSKNAARKIVYGVERDIKICKNAEEEDIRYMHFQVIKNWKYKGEINVTEPLCISRNEGFRVYEISSAFKDVLYLAGEPLHRIWMSNGLRSIRWNWVGKWNFPWKNIL